MVLKTKRPNPLKVIVHWIIVALLVVTLLAWINNVAYSQIDNDTTYDNSPQNVSGLINYSPTTRWLLNKDGRAQEYVELKAPINEVRLRTREMLMAYGREDTYGQWETIGILYGIKTEFLVCVAKAETQLGKYTKSSNNLANVGNNDRGDTIHYNHWIQGIGGVGKTLNNRYLGSYNELWQLSRYGNKDSYIYASSPENWHKNVHNCLSNIHGYDVGNAYEFRR